MKTAFFLILFSILILNSGITRADDCGCARDGLSNTKCGPIPSDVVFSKKVTCKFSLFAQEVDVQKIAYSRVAYSGAPFCEKSDQELLNYFSCYRNRTRPEKPTYDKFDLCHYKNTIKPLLEKAAKASGFPLATEACQIFMESRFDPFAHSQANANGYAQFKTAAIAQVNEAVRYTVPEYLKAIAEIEHSIAALSRKNLKKDQKELHVQEAILKRRKAKLAARKVWDKYWGKTKPPKVSIDGRKQEGVELRTMSCAQIAMIAFQVKKANDFALISDDGGTPTEDENGRHRINNITADETSIIISAGYNAGFARFPEQCSDPQSFTECLKSYKGNKETSNYMKGIRNCAQGNSFAPVDGLPELNSKKPGLRSYEEFCEKRVCDT